MHIERFLIASDFLETYSTIGIPIMDMYVFTDHEDEDTLISNIIMYFDIDLTEDGECTKFIHFKEEARVLDEENVEYIYDIQLYNKTDYDDYDETDILIQKLFDELCMKHELGQPINPLNN